MTRRLRRLGLLPLIVLALAAVALACGDDDDGGGAPVTPTLPAATLTASPEETARPGEAVQRAIQTGNARGLAELSFSRRGSPFSLRTEWGVKDGRAAAEKIGVRYAARF